MYNANGHHDQSHEPHSVVYMHGSNNKKDNTSSFEYIAIILSTRENSFHSNIAMELIPILLQKRSVCQISSSLHPTSSLLMDCVSISYSSVLQQ